MKKTTIYTLLCTTLMSSISMASERIEELRRQKQAVPTTPVRVGQMEAEGKYNGLSPFTAGVVKKNDERKIHLENASTKAKLDSQIALEQTERERAQERAAAEARHQQEVEALQAVTQRVQAMAAQMAEQTLEISTLREQNEALSSERSRLEERKRQIEGELQKVTDSRERNVSLLQQELEQVSIALIEKTKAEAVLTGRVKDLEEQQTGNTRMFKTYKEQKTLLEVALGAGGKASALEKKDASKTSSRIATTVASEKSAPSVNSAAALATVTPEAEYHSDDDLGDTSIVSGNNSDKK